MTRDPDAAPSRARRGRDSAPRLFLIAGEVSGDVYGAHLAVALRALRPEVELVAVGGPRMAAAGARCIINSAGWEAIGWMDVLPRIPLFLARLAAVRRAIDRSAPDAVVLIDFPGFNLALAQRLRGEVPVVYFVPPMVSTRRGDRGHRIARLGMRLLAVFPFEAEAYRKAGADVVFVGHPAVDRIQPGDDLAAIRRRLSLPAGGPVLALLPGSRRQELRRHLPVIAGAMSIVRARYPEIQAVVPVASPRFRLRVERALHGFVPVSLVVGGSAEGDDAMAGADFAVVTSGTATLEALCAGVPAVVIYKLDPIDAWIARHIAAVRWVGLPSLLAGREVMPELVQEALTAPRLASVVLEWLADPARRARQREELVALRARLGPPGVVDRAAREVLRHARLLGVEASSTIQTT